MSYLLSYLWVPVLMIAAATGAYVANLNNQGVAYGKLYVVLASFMTMFTWLWVTCVSKNLVFDSLVFDMVLAVVFTSCLIGLQSSGHSFTLVNYIGVALALVGLVCLKA